MCFQTPSHLLPSRGPSRRHFLVYCYLLQCYPFVYTYKDTTGLIDSSYIFFRTYPSHSLNFYPLAGMYLLTLGYHKLPITILCIYPEIEE